MQDVHVKLKPGLPQQNQHSTRRRLFSLAYRTYISGRNWWSATFGV